jgi:hypothetical protein
MDNLLTSYHQVMGIEENLSQEWIRILPCEARDARLEGPLPIQTFP